MRIVLEIKVDQFVAQLAQEVITGGLTVVDAIERLIVDHLEQSIASAPGLRLTTAPRAVVHSMYYIDRFANLGSLQQTGYATWYTEVRFAIQKGDPLISDVTTSGFVHGYDRYGGGSEKAIRHNRRELKTQINYTLRLNKLLLPGNIFRHTSKLIATNATIEQPLIANLTVGCERFIDDRIPGFRVVAFDHVVTGERRFCSCHNSAHAAMMLDARQRAPSYVRDAWPHRVIGLLEDAVYSEDICHFCITAKHGEAAATDRYGFQIRSHYTPYIDLLVRGYRYGCAHSQSRD